MCVRARVFAQFALRFAIFFRNSQFHIIGFLTGKCLDIFQRALQFRCRNCGPQFVCAVSVEPILQNAKFKKHITRTT